VRIQSTYAQGKEINNTRVTTESDSERDREKRADVHERHVVGSHTNPVAVFIIFRILEAVKGS
jgi:hypothetical protein